MPPRPWRSCRCPRWNSGKWSRSSRRSRRTSSSSPAGRRGTSVMVVPQRPAVLAAKALATVDVLSHGRLTVGGGVGWLDEEFQAGAAPPFAERGRVTDEFLAAFHELWTSEAPRFAGQH